ncbi:hypothetical protein HX037_09110 [Ignatzschineria indica]|nr:hypothetical protein [Ignatzschineria indica]MDM1546030.1 hypothetical protein [Ignatzschineria indica]
MIKPVEADELPDLTVAYFHQFRAGKWQSSIAGKYDHQRAMDLHRFADLS